MEYYNPYYLAHHGILGMKWGIRRYQNPDGSLTPAGEKRYSTNKRFRAQVDNMRAKSQVSKNTKEMSDDDLRKAIDRMQLEDRYAQLMNSRLPTVPPPSKAQQFATKLASMTADRLISNLSDNLGKRMGKLISDSIFGPEGNSGGNKNKEKNKDKNNDNNQNNGGKNKNKNKGNNNQNQNNPPEKETRKERREREARERREEWFKRMDAQDRQDQTAYDRAYRAYERERDRQDNIRLREREQNLRYAENIARAQAFTRQNEDRVVNTTGFTRSEDRDRTVRALAELARMNGR